MKILKLRVAPKAASALNKLGLSQPDLAVIMRFSREGMTLAFDLEKAPAGLHDQLRHLVGITLIIDQNVIEDIVYLDHHKEKE